MARKGVSDRKEGVMRNIHKKGIQSCKNGGWKRRGGEEGKLGKTNELGVLKLNPGCAGNRENSRRGKDEREKKLRAKGGSSAENTKIPISLGSGGEG